VPSPPSGAPLLPLVAIAVLLLLLVLVLAQVVRTIRRGAQQVASPSTSGGGLGDLKPVQLSGLSDSPTEEEIADLTRLKAFSPDLLPKLSYDDDEDPDEKVADDSHPNLRYEPDAERVEPIPPNHDLIVTSAASQTDRGLKRTRNEDACLIDAPLDLYIVADGMGGYAGGDVAANTAVAEVRKVLQAGRPTEAPGPFLTPPEWPQIGRELGVAIERANAIIHDVSTKSKQLEGMGTTILAVRFSRREQRAYIAYVGDSRLYRLRAGKLVQLTEDHTLGAKGVVGPLASNIRRAVGVAPSVKVDLLVDKPMPADLYVLCSDGAYKMVKDPEMEKLLAGTAAARSRATGWAEADLKERVDTIIKAANAAGGKDNITVILVGVGDATTAMRSASGSLEKRA
jgi:serine/threonine protein phosphatase PrpC